MAFSVQLPSMSMALVQIMERLSRVPVVLVGDLMLDRYLYGNAERLSPEAPVPVLHYQKETLSLGGAGGVAADLAALGAEVRTIGITGADDPAEHVRRLLVACGADTGGVLQCADRPTVSKTRLVGLAQHRHPQQMMRIDFEELSPLPQKWADRVVAEFEKAIDGARMVCLEDYNKGLLSVDVCQRMIAIARKRGLPVLVDPASISEYDRYRGATAVKLNRLETEKASRLPVQEESQFAPAAEWLLDNLDLEAAIITLDKHGSYLATRDGERRWLKTRPRQVYDVTGAGDMVLSMLAVARATGAGWVESVALANVAGGLEVERFGSVPIRPGEIIQELLNDVHEHQGKQRTLESLLPEIQHHRNAGKRVVFTNGCFDLIHLGHIKYFQFARQQGDLLVVAVNTDQSIRGLKGDKRPIIGEADRLSVLEELESIDYLICFDDENPLRLIEKIRPDVLVKGADYQKEQVVGWDIVEGYGGRVALAPLVDGRSTSAVIKRILEAYR
jgi:D-beta-D-heptose 7-phosphate kinase/D-beta-D-heptose 1-phosphate adenosyltransferase